MGKEANQSKTTQQGVVKWFNAAKGYGFISRNDDDDVFVHYSAIQAHGYRTVDNGVTVEFELQETDKGPQAANVRVIGAG